MFGAGALFLATLATASVLIRREISGPVKRLVDYVKNQHESLAYEPPEALLNRSDEIGLLTSEIRYMLEALKRQNEILLEQSLNDPLTGLGNRRLLEQRLDIILPMSRRGMMPLSVLMIDVDHFKAYNDHYGHPAGDECLLEIANVLQDTFRRETDILIRMGGEEFMVVLLDFGIEESYRMAEAIRGKLQRIAMPHEKSPAANVVTVSIGVATVEPGTRIEVAELIAGADAALYRCKAQGRNCSIRSVVNAKTVVA